MDYAALKTEILNGGAYADYVAAGDDVHVADLLNAPGAGTVSMPVVTKSQFLLSIIPAVAALASASDAVQKKWDRFLGIVQSVDQIAIEDASIQALLAVAVSDGLLTNNQAATINQRDGSRAEVLLGVGTIVSIDDVATALRGNV